MAVQHIILTDEQRQRRRRETAAQTASALMFVVLAESGETFDPTTLGEHAALFDIWRPNVAYRRGQIRIDETDGNLYRALHDHGAEHATDPPSQSPNLWGRVVNPADEWPAWFPFAGVADAWMKGDRASHNGRRWISNVDFNVWEPGAPGVRTWDEWEGTE